MSQPFLRYHLVQPEEEGGAPSSGLRAIGCRAQTSAWSLGLSEIHRFDWLTAVLAWELLETQNGS